VDTLGLVLLVMVTAADVQDCDGARTLFSGLTTQFRRLRVIWQHFTLTERKPLIPTKWIDIFGRHGQEDRNKMQVAVFDRT
jgi:hypothetical protein